jgi:hypothetical protein
MEVSGQLHAPAALPPGKEPLGLGRRIHIKMDLNAIIFEDVDWMQLV